MILALLMFMLSSCQSSYRYYIPRGHDSYPGDWENRFTTCESVGLNMRLWKVPTTFDDLEGTSISFDGKNLLYRSSYYIKQNDASDEPGSFYSIYDNYYSEKTRECITVLHGTDIITAYDNGGLPNSYDSKISQSEAQTIAEEFLLKIISQEDFKDLTLRSIEDDRLTGGYTLYYSRYLEGYFTDESASVTVHPLGRVDNYNGEYILKYKDLRITKKQLDAAYAQLKEQVDALDITILEYYDPNITTNTSGDVFLGLGFQYELKDGTTAGCGLTTKVALFPTEIVFICCGAAVVLIAAGAVILIRHRKKKSA